MASKELIKYINPQNFEIIGFDGQKFVSVSQRDKLYSVSRILYDFVIAYSFKLPKEQTKSDISSIAEIKMYEEAGLDTNKEYKITYMIKELDFDEMNLVEAFAVDVSLIKQLFESNIKKIKYIDFLALPFLSFSTFYKNKILKPKNDIFVYMDCDEAFLSFYKDGSYISTKSTVTLNEVVAKFVDSNINIDINELYDIFAQKGFQRDLYTEEETSIINLLEEIFSDIFTKINNIAMHNRSVFGFDKIDRIFFSTKRGRVKGLREFVQNFGFEDVEILDFNLFKEKQKDNFLDNVVASYGFDKYKEKTDTQNVTVFPKPKPFLSTQAGKLILMLSLFVLVSGSIFGYLQYKNSMMENELNMLKIEYSSIIKRAKRYKKKIAANNIKIKKLKNELKKQDIYYKNIENSINKLYDMHNSENSYVDFIARVNKLMARYKLKCKSILQEKDKKLTIEVISSYQNRDKIAKFIKALIDKGFVNVSTNEIKLDKDRYISKIEIENE